MGHSFCILRIVYTTKWWDRQAEEHLTPGLQHAVSSVSASLWVSALFPHCKLVFSTWLPAAAGLHTTEKEGFFHSQHEEYQRTLFSPA